MENLIDQLSNISLIENYDNYFKGIAKNMFENYCIKKGEDIYYFTSLEFYFCHKNHFDMITYPRNAKAGQWFFHQSGVDLTFNSHFFNLSKYNYTPIVSIDNDYAYGGILVKEVVKQGGAKQLKGPCIAMWELFDKINAFPIKIDSKPMVDVANWPVIIESKGFDDIEPVSRERVLRLENEEKITKKFRSLNKDIFNNVIPYEAENSFKKIVKKNYRFEVPVEYYAL